MARLAEWTRPGAGPPLRTAPGGGHPAALARKGLGHIVRSAHILLGGEEATGRGLLESLDAREKVAGLLLVLVAATLAKRPEAIAGVLAASWIVALASGLDMKRFLLGISVVPLFTLPIALPAALKSVRDELAVLLGLPPRKVRGRRAHAEDRDPRVRWRYAQERGRPREYAVRVEVVPASDALGVVEAWEAADDEG